MSSGQSKIDTSFDDNLNGLGVAYSQPNSFNPLKLNLYINDYPNGFIDRSKASGITQRPDGSPIEGKVLAVQPIDLNEDGLMDVFVANDIWRNFCFLLTKVMESF